MKRIPLGIYNNQGHFYKKKTEIKKKSTKKKNSQQNLQQGVHTFSVLVT